MKQCDTLGEIQPAQVHNVLAKHVLMDGFGLVLDLDASTGSWIVDARNGDSYLDMFSFYGSNALGMNHPALTSVPSLARAATCKPPNSGVYTLEYAQFVDTFETIAGDPDLPHLFFIEGGALAVENALKAAFDWKSRRNEAAGRDSGLGTKILHLTDAFHGRSGYTMSLTNSAAVKIARYPKFDWPRIPVPAIHRFPGDDALREAEDAALSSARQAFERQPHDIAAFIAEPIQGEGGDNHIRPEFLRAMQALCHEHDALFILDEVQTGCGLTGSMWAYQQMDLQPDIVCFGKKFQVCGVMAGRRVDEERDNVFQVSGRIASTWGGNLSDMVRATHILRVLHEEDLPARAALLGGELLARLDMLSEKYPDVVTSVRGRGLWCAFDLADLGTRDEVLARLLTEERVLLLPCGSRSIRFRPTLTVTSAELELACAAIDRVVAKV